MALLWPKSPADVFLADSWAEKRDKWSTGGSPVLHKSLTDVLRDVVGATLNMMSNMWTHVNVPAGGCLGIFKCRRPLFQHQPQVGAKAPADSTQMIRTCQVNTHFQVYTQKCWCLRVLHIWVRNHSESRDISQNFTGWALLIRVKPGSGSDWSSPRGTTPATTFSKISWVLIHYSSLSSSPVMVWKKQIDLDLSWFINLKPIYIFYHNVIWSDAIN